MCFKLIKLVKVGNQGSQVIVVGSLTVGSPLALPIRIITYYSISKNTSRPPFISISSKFLRITKHLTYLSSTITSSQSLNDT